MRLRVLRDDFDQLHRHLFRNGLEQHAFLLAERSTDVLIVRELLLADPKRDLAKQTPVYIALNPQYALSALERAIEEDLHLVDVHSHPFTAKGVSFSSTDFRSAASRFEWHQERAPQMISVGLVMGTESAEGRFVAPEVTSPMPLESVEIAGDKHEVWQCTSTSRALGVGSGSAHNRQILAFGEEGQRRIASLRVAIVGLGGTGSAVASLLSHLGVRNFALIDPDQVEVTNLNRLIGATMSDAEAGTLKVDVARRTILSLGDASVEVAPTSVDSPAAEQLLNSADFVFGCGDNVGVRAVLANFCARRLLPYIDLGSGISMAADGICEAGGQVFCYWPGRACLNCFRPFDGYAAAAALRSPGERSVIEAAYGTESPQPSVVTINCTLAGIATGEFLKYATGWACTATAITYDARANHTESIEVARSSSCATCRYARLRQAPQEMIACLS